MWDKVHSTMQIVGAALAIPAAAAGTYTAYRTYFSLDVACAKLHASILTVMERNISSEAKTGLLRKDVGEYGKMCGKSDQESLLIFQAAMNPPSPPPRSEPASAATVAPPTRTAAAGPPQSMVAAVPDDSFGLSPSGEKRGWVALQRREPGKDAESHFDEYAVTDPALPSAGVKLTARRLIPVWMEPLPPGPNPPEKLQGRLAAGGCVRVLTTKPGAGRNWAEVVPINCF